MTSAQERTLSPTTYFLQRSLGAGTSWGMFVLASNEIPSSQANREWNRQSNYALNLVHRGQGSVRYGSTDAHKLSSGSLYQHFPDTDSQIINWENQPPPHESFLVLDRRLYGRLADLGLIPSFQVITPAKVDELTAKFHRLFTTLSDIPEHPNFRPLLLSKIIDFLTQVSQIQSENRNDPWDQALESIRARVDSDPSSRTSLPDIAQSLGVSYSSIRYHFKRRFGLSLSEYRIRARIDAAQSILPFSSVSETAEKLGYTDAFTFSTQFRKQTGMSPREFKSQFFNSPT
ncbi:helix-turn-helix domain-containing protein [Pelagicoccus mobilis]|uniref:Helix-turn-helix transcriptional regulator n=1 Tax=Pelagicoccus mobilis TaxID=415221 RepID=A0A934VNZ7_9BACT|nr:AraC family transcriptional regulator [Pelagicoccus mobilis]MBK1880476.1 helix-turn-helix transcriptional regulator [Pelagicoccus mobilis]